LVESSNGGGAAAAPSGVPGATSNQPPGAATAPVNGAAQTLAASGGVGGAAAGAANGGSKRESIINYEVDKTVRVVRGSPGLVKRISAAVVLNHQTITDEKGKTQMVPLSAEQMEKMNALVRETIGFNKDRGDSVNLMNAPFATEKLTVVDLPWWRQPELQDMARSFAWPVGTFLLAALLMLGVVRPAMKALVPGAAGKGRGAQLDALESEELARSNLLTGPDGQPIGAGAALGAIENNGVGGAQVVLGHGATGLPVLAMSPAQQRLEEARKLTRDNPVAVANIVKSWIGSEAPA
jgi:flagellar M-ring protein FliF